MSSDHSARTAMGLFIAAVVALLGVASPLSFASGLTTVDVLHAFQSPPNSANRPTQGRDGLLYGTTQTGGSFGGGTVFRLNWDGTDFTVLHSFDGRDGAYPVAGLLQGSDGALYGTTALGGVSGKNFGTVFTLQPDGTGFAVLHSFTNTAGDGAVPSAGLLQGGDGALYGTTQFGGAFGTGTVFRISRDGTGFTVLHSFAGADGGKAAAALIQGDEGALYGTTIMGGAFGGGTVFKLQPDGSAFSVLYSFSGQDGSPWAGLVWGSDGALYGTTQYGGASNLGTVFRLQTDGSAFTVLHSFAGADGADLRAGLIQGSDGTLYGTASGGLYSAPGTVFALRPDGTGFNVLYSFSGVEGGVPGAGLIQGSDGRLYGATWAGGAFNCGNIFTLQPNGTDFRVLHSFDSTDAANPAGGLLLGSDGALYGITQFGGSSSTGSVFKLQTDGSDFSVLHALGGAEGFHPTANLIQAGDGALYGTAQQGGEFNLGTVFTLRPDGTGFTVLHSFNNTDGSNPAAGLLWGSDGALYGTTQYGGASNLGTVFKLQPDGTGFSVLHDFGGLDGETSRGNLSIGSDSALYGTTINGGAFGGGIVFKLQPDGTGFSVLHSFSGPDGSPWDGLLWGSDGALYGTTQYGGASNLGTVFRLQPDGTRFSVLHDFGGADGAGVRGNLIQGSDGGLYGTTQQGGDSNLGTVFTLRPDGTGFTVLHSFNNTDGSNPVASLIQGRDGALYGTTSLAGHGGGGVVFRLPQTYNLSVQKAGTGTGTVTSTPTAIDCGDACAANFNVGANVALTATPASGSTFTGWTGDCTGTEPCTVSMTQARTVTASFALETFPLTVTKAGTGSGTVTSSPAGVDCGSTCSASFDFGTSMTLTATPVNGSIFTGWSGACSGTGSTCTVTMDAAKSITATFGLASLPSLTVATTGPGSVTSSPAGISCGSDCAETYAPGTSVTLTASPQSTLEGWVQNPANGRYYRLTEPGTWHQAETQAVAWGGHLATIRSAEENAWLTATFDNTGGYWIGFTDEGSEGQWRWVSGEPVTYTNWYGDQCGSEPNNAWGNENWAILNWYNYVDLCNGQPKIGPGQWNDLSLGTTRGIAESVAPPSDSIFIGWSGDCAFAGTSPTCTLTMDAARSVAATFTAIPSPTTHSLTVITAGPGSVTDGSSLSCPGTCGGTYAAGTTVTLTATAGAGFFAGWGGACAAAVSGPSGGSCTLTMDAAKSVTAAFSSTAAPPTGLSPYDDFSSVLLDPAHWVSPREVVREIRNGNLVIAHGGSAVNGGATNVQARHAAPPTNLQSLQADIKLTGYAPPPGGRVRLRLRGTFYNDGYGGGGATGRTGDVVAQIYIRAWATTGPQIGYNLYRCNDATCNSTSDLEMGLLVNPANANQSYTLGIAWNGTQFTFTVDGTPTVVIPAQAPPVSGPRVAETLLRAEIQALDTSGAAVAGGNGYVAGTFDNVFVNGTLYDNFDGTPYSGPRLDPSKWLDRDTARETVGGQLLSKTVTAGQNLPMNTLSFPTPSAVTAMAADVTLTEAILGTGMDWGHAGLQGRFYNIGTGTALGDVVAGIGYGVSGDGSTGNVFFQMYRSDAGQFIPLANDTFAAGILMNVPHHLMLAWDGAVFTYGMDSTIRALDPRPLAPVSSAPVTPGRWLFTTGSSYAVIAATFDNVSVNAEANPAPTLTVFPVGAGIVTSDVGGINCGATCSAMVTAGTVVTLTATPASGAIFTGWSGACSGTSPTCTLTMDSGKSVTATFDWGPPPPSYTLSVVTSGAGVVTSSPAGIACGSTCSASFTQGTVVTLTAIPEGGGSFRSWSGACGGAQTTCTLTVDAAKSVTAVFSGTGAVPTDLSLYDGFSTAYLDPTRWASPRESIRRIQDGLLVLAHSGSASSDNNSNTSLRHVNPPTNLTSLQVDVTLTAAAPPVAGGYSRLRLRGAFYNDGTPGTGSLGDVWAHTGLRVGSSGSPEAFYNLYRCADADCNFNTDNVGGALGPVAVGQPYTVRIDWDKEANAGAGQLTFTLTPVGGGSPITQIVTPPRAPVGSPRVGQLLLRAEVTSWATSPGVLDGYTAGTFDNVTINGALYDDFSSPQIDPAKWRDYTIGRTLQAGALVLQAQAQAGKNQYTSLRVPNPSAMTLMAADVTLTATSLGVSQDVAHAGFQGVFYNTGTGTALGDVHGQVYYWTRGDGTVEVHFNTWRSDNAGQFIQLFGETLATGLTLGEPRRLLLAWDGAVFTYGLDSLIRTFDPRPLAPVARPPVNPSRELYAQATAATGGTASLTATFGNILVNPEAIAALPGLRPRSPVLLAGDVTAAGVGLRGTGTGTINLTGIPAGATVQQAFLYWATLGTEGAFTTPTLNGIAVAGTVIGQGDDPNWGAAQSYAYWADVTALVSGNGSYVITGLPAAGPTVNDTEGASLVVLYTVPGAPLRQIALSDGLATLTSGRLPVARAPFAGLRAVDPAGAHLTLLAGNGQVTSATARDFAGLDGTLLATDPFSGSAGAAWDTIRLDASPALTPGATEAAAILSTWGDSLVWVAAYLSTTPQSPALTVTLTGSGRGTVTSSPAGISCPGDCSEAYASPTSVTLTATPGMGSTFTGWSGACTGTNSACMMTVDAAKLATATFTQVAETTATLTVALTGTGTGTVTSSPAGISCPGDCSEAYVKNASVTLTAAAGTLSAFPGWGGACAGITAPTCTVAMEVSKTVTATFTGTTDTSAVLTVMVSGPGRVTSGDNRINCPGECTETYSKNTTVTLTATPEGGGIFRGWTGACGGSPDTCTVLLDQTKSITAFFAGTVSPPTGLSLYDDFSQPLLDPGRWANLRESTREIRDGRLFMSAGVTAYTDNNPRTVLRPLTFPTGLQSVQADARLTAAQPLEGGWSRMRIRPVFYNDGTSGTGSLGDVIGNMVIRRGTGDPEIHYYITRCDDADCNFVTVGAEGILVPHAAFDQTYTLSITRAGTDFTFTATPEGGSPVSVAVTSPYPVAGPPRSPNLSFRAEVIAAPTGPGAQGYVAGTFDNISIDDSIYAGGVLADDFSGLTIDPTKWTSQDIDMIREVQNGALVFRSVAPTGNRKNSLQVINPNAVRTMVADVTLTDAVLTAPVVPGQAGLQGTFYSTGTGTTAGDVRAAIYYQTPGDGTATVFFGVSWIDGQFWDPIITSILPAGPHRFLLSWDGAVFTYGVDGIIRTFDPRPLAPVVRPPLNPARELFTFSGSRSDTVGLRATFDNVYVNSEALAALPGLVPRSTTVLAGDVAAAGVGLRGIGAGAITLSTLPTNATVEQAWLYWATLGIDGTFTSPTLNGIPVSGTLIGRGDDPGRGAHQSHAYRADVTSLVTAYAAAHGSANGTYIIAGLPADHPTTNDTEGASLVVLYSVPNAPLRQIAISDGIATLTSGRLPAAFATLPALWPVDPAGTRLILLAGDGEVGSGYTVRDYAGLNTTLLATDGFQGADGAAWDTKTYDASTALTLGATQATVVVSTASDTIVWVAAILSTALQTPTGNNVTVQPIDTTTGIAPVALTFSTVTQPGLTSLTTSASGPPPPTGFQLGDPPRYYELTTTATYAGPITVCINYTGVSYTDPASLRLFHYEGGSWVDRTVSLNTPTSTICAQVTSLSPFAIFERIDTTPPVIGPVTNLTVEATSTAGAVVSFVVTATDAVDPAPVVTASPASGSTFPLGTTTVTVTARDRFGNTSTKTFTVTVRDTTPPVIGAASDVATTAKSPAGAVVTFVLPTATDAVDPSPVVTSSPASGSTFPIGTTSVTVTAKDVANNVSARTFTVTVNAPSPTPGMMHGDGRLDQTGRRAQYDFEVRERATGGDHGHLRFSIRALRPGGHEGDRDDRTGHTDSFVSTRLTDVVFYDLPGVRPGGRATMDTVVFKGIGRWNDRHGYTFTATATDAGEPGARRDSFAITITAPNGTAVATVSGTITQGNNQSNRVRR